MDYNKILKKLVKIANQQQKALEKLAQMAPKVYMDPDTASDLRESYKALSPEDQEGEYEDPLGNQEEEYYEDPFSPEALEGKGKIALEKAIQSGDGLPADFDKKVQHYLRMKNKYSDDFNSTLNQLRSLALKDISSWATLGEYFEGWSPKNVADLYRKLI